MCSSDLERECTGLRRQRPAGVRITQPVIQVDHLKVAFQDGQVHIERLGRNIHARLLDSAIRVRGRQHTVIHQHQQAWRAYPQTPGNGGQGRQHTRNQAFQLPFHAFTTEDSGSR